MGFRNYLKEKFGEREETEYTIPEARIINYDEYISEMEKLPKSTGRKILSEEELKETVISNIEAWQEHNNSKLSEIEETKLYFSSAMNYCEGMAVFRLNKTEEGILEINFKYLETIKANIEFEGYENLVQQWKENGLPESELPTEYDVKAYLQAYEDTRQEEWKYEPPKLAKKVTLENGKAVRVWMGFTDMEVTGEKIRFIRLYMYEV